MSSRAIGLYIHVPFCRAKCPYCDFYSLTCVAEHERYIRALSEDMLRLAPKKLAADTLYIGGGTPSVLQGDGLTFLLESAACAFLLDKNAEISVELNPADVDARLAGALFAAGVNRVSMGVQSGVDSELAALGRRHDSRTAVLAVTRLREAGIENISLDLMLATPGQTEESLAYSIDFLASLEPKHISAYILKIERGTPFYERQSSLVLPDEDVQARLYLLAAERLASLGYAQYEISNFSLPGFESRHNLKYWDCMEYLGFGPSAHSFFEGRRSFYPRDLSGYINKPQIVDDGEGGSLREYAMLRLRLCEGLAEKGMRERFGIDIPKSVREYAEPLEEAGLLISDAAGIRLLPRGFLVSNSIIAEIIDRL